MQGYLSLILHAHLPFVRHPEHERFLEESWLFEAITETYIPLLQMLESWERERLAVRLTVSLTPTLCSMLRDPLLQERCARRLDELIELADREKHRTQSQRPVHELAGFYRARLGAIRAFYQAHGWDLISAFRQLQERERLEIITSAATHALLPIVAQHRPSLRGQIFVARDHYRTCFGRDPRSIWLPECAYDESVEDVLREAGLRWVILETHGILHARPRPRYAVFAPILTPKGIAVFGRDPDSAQQIWSREKGFPGDPRYRDFYRDIGFDLDFDYVQPYLPAPGRRGFTGLKYYRITNRAGPKEFYNRPTALAAAAEHAKKFFRTRTAQVRKLTETQNLPPILVCPYDAELFGHWWYEGPEFLDFLVRSAATRSQGLSLTTPEDYLCLYPELQVARPASSSWGEGGYGEVWLNEENQWILPHLTVAQERMTELVCRFTRPNSLQQRALNQAARELLLAQASDWPFILRSGTSPDYARARVKDHLLRFTRLYEQLSHGLVNEERLKVIESQDNIFPEVYYRYWSDRAEIKPANLQAR